MCLANVHLISNILLDFLTNEKQQTSSLTANQYFRMSRIIRRFSIHSETEDISFLPRDFFVVIMDFGCQSTVSWRQNISENI